MTDFARRLYQDLVAEPYRIKVVEHLHLPDRNERERILQDAFYSPVHLNSADIYIDLVTDSGSGAMSHEQWSALMRGDEAYMRSRSYFKFEDAVRRVTGYQHVIPTHQGRAAENIVMELMVGPDDIVLNNTHFDTTRAHVENRKALPVDLMHGHVWNFSEPHPFKGNFDLAKLEAALKRHHSRVPLIVITLVNNLACSSPVSMENIRSVRHLADRYKIPVFIDASRFAENAYFIQQREPGYAEKSVPDIAQEMLSYGDACWMSAKKGAIVNIGGFIAARNEEFAHRCMERAVLYEGFYTYGGLARRDLEAIAVGLEEGLDEEFLRHRIDQVVDLGRRARDAGIVVSEPVGGSGVFVDVGALYPHLPPERLPGIAFCSDMYLEGGIRVAAAPFPIKTVDPRSGDLVERVFQFARLAIPRRVYTKSHMEYVAEILRRVKERASTNTGYRVVSGGGALGHFFARFAKYI